MMLKNLVRIFKPIFATKQDYRKKQIKESSCEQNTKAPQKNYTLQIMDVVHTIAKKYNLSSKDIEKRLAEFTPIVDGLMPPMAIQAIDHGAFVTGDAKPSHLKGKTLHARWIPYMLLLSQGKQIRITDNDIQKHFRLGEIFSILKAHYFCNKNKLTEQEYSEIEKLLKAIYNVKYTDSDSKDKIIKLANSDNKKYLVYENEDKLNSIIEKYVMEARQHGLKFYWNSIGRLVGVSYPRFVEESQTYLKELSPEENRAFHQELNSTLDSHLKRLDKCCKNSISTIMLHRDEVIEDILPVKSLGKPKYSKIGANNKMQRKILHYIVRLDLMYQLLQVLVDREVISKQKMNSQIKRQFGFMFGFLENSVSTYKKKSQDKITINP